MSEEEIGCGISWLWMTSKDDPFYNACKIHDILYDIAKTSTGYSATLLKEADVEFWRLIKEASKGSLKLRARAYLYYSLVTAWRHIRIRLK